MNNLGLLRQKEIVTQTSQFEHVINPTKIHKTKSFLENDFDEKIASLLQEIQNDKDFYKIMRLILMYKVFLFNKESY